MPLLGQVLGFLLSGDTFSIDLGEYLDGKIYLTFSEAPRATDATASNDALNPANYTLNGSSPNAIGSVAITGNPAVLALTPLYPLEVGYWQIQVSSSVANAGVTAFMGTPNSWTVLVGDMVTARAISMGAENQDAFDILSDFLNPAYRDKPNWSNVMEVLSVGEQNLYDNARKAYDQLYASTASGKYLTQRAGDQGLSRPPGVGLTDDLFRQFVIRNANRQLTEEAILAILEVFYGKDSVRATCVSTLSQPYNIADGDTLSVLIDEKTSVKVVFQASDFGIQGRGTAIEVSSAITRWMSYNGSTAVAVPWENPEDGLTYVKIYSYGIGLGSAVRVTGGLAQEALRFPAYLDLYTADPLPDWDITYDAVSQTVRFTAQGPGMAVNPNLHDLRVGDYVNIVGEEFADGNRGSFTITDLDVYYTFEAVPETVLWFEVTNADGVSETVTQDAEASISFYRPEKQDSYIGPTTSVVVADLPTGLDVILPATSPAVSRTSATASYLHTPTTHTITSAEAIDGVLTVNTSLSHGLIVGQQVYLEDLVASSSLPTITPASSGVSASSVANTWSVGEALLSGAFYRGFSCKLSDDKIVLGYGMDTTGGTVTLKGFGEVIDYSYSVTAGELQVNHTHLSFAAPTAMAYVRADRACPALETIYGQSAAFVTGGFDAASGIFFNNNVVHLFNGDGSTTALTSMLTVRSGHCSAVFGNNHFAFGGSIGGWQYTGTQSEKYTPTTNSWGIISAMPSSRFEAASAVLPSSLEPNGVVVISGGRTLALGPYLETNTLAIWNLNDSTTTPAGSGTYGVSLTSTNTPFVTTTAGLWTTARNPNSRNALAYYETTSGTTGTPAAGLRTAFTGSYTVEGWFRYDGTTMTNAFFAMTAASTPAVPADNILFGFGPSYNVNSKWGIYWDDNTTNRILLEANLPIINTLLRDWNHWCVTVEDIGPPNKFVSLYINGDLIQYWTTTGPIAGQGTNTTIAMGRDTNVYPSNGGKFALGQVRVSSGAFTAAEVWDAYQKSAGEVLWDVPLFGFNAAIERIGVVKNTVDAYYVDSNTWNDQTWGPMSMARAGHAMVGLPNGDLVVIGGVGYNPTEGIRSARYLRECEICSYKTRRWSPIASLPVGAGGFMWAKYSADLNAILAGGSIDGHVYQYSLTKRVWTRVVGASVDVGYTFQTAELLPSAVAIFGGSEPNGEPTTDDQSYVVMTSPTYFKGGVEGRMLQVRSGSGTTFTVDAPDATYRKYTGGTVLVCKPVADTNLSLPGPFLYSPFEGMFTTRYRSDTTSLLYRNNSYAEVGLSDIADWPESGYVVFDFGGPNEAGPVQYYAKLDDETLLIDQGFVFPKDLAAGTSVDLLYSKGPYSPVSTEGQGPFYLTDSPAGRAAAQKAVQDAVAVGVVTNVTIAYPGDRGMGGEGYPTAGSGKLSDVVEVFAHDTDGEEA